MFRASIVLRKHHIFPINNIYHNQSACKSRCNFNRVRKTRLHILLNHKTVYHNFNGMFFVLLQFNFFGQIINHPVNSHAYISGFSGRFKFFYMLAFSSSYNRSQYLYFGTFLQCHHMVHNLVNGLLFDFSAADRTVWNADSGIQQTQIVINFRYCTYSGTRIFRCGFLVNGNSGRQSINIIHIRLFHLT